MRFPVAGQLQRYPLNGSAIIERLCADLAGSPTGDPTALWEHIADAFERLEGRPIDRTDDYETAIASAVHRRLIPTLY